MHIQTDRACVPADTPDVRYLHITINAPHLTTGDESRPPASIGLVLDRSGSMDGQKIAMAREAVAHATRLLKPNDNLAIVCYDEEVTTVLEKTPASQEAKRLALEKLAKIAARGSTDLHGGWTRGAQLLATPSSQSDAIAKVMLMTDGLANHGVVDRSELLEVARQLRAAGVITSTFGVGQDFDENLLSQMAIEGGGHFYFIETPKQIPDFLASELGETLEVVARDVSRSASSTICQSSKSAIGRASALDISCPIRRWSWWSPWPSRARRRVVRAWVCNAGSRIVTACCRACQSKFNGAPWIRLSTASKRSTQTWSSRQQECSPIAQGARRSVSTPKASCTKRNRSLPRC
jgi:uncharacterized protein YegL